MLREIRNYYNLDSRPSVVRKILIQGLCSCNTIICLQICWWLWLLESFGKSIESLLYNPFSSSCINYTTRWHICFRVVQDSKTTQLIDYLLPRVNLEMLAFEYYMEITGIMPSGQVHGPVSSCDVMSQVPSGQLHGPVPSSDVMSQVPSGQLHGTGNQVVMWCPKCPVVSSMVQYQVVMWCPRCPVAISMIQSICFLKGRLGSCCLICPGWGHDN